MSQLTSAPPPPAPARNFTKAIIIVSIAIPAAIAFLILVPQAKIDFGFNTRTLPLFHAILNSSTAILLLASLWFIRHGQFSAHRTANWIAVALSTVFLVSYVIYHASNPSTRFGDLNHDGLLSDAEKQQAYQQKFALHRKLARITWPLWLYVAVTGVVVYIMISPYY
jgi:putative membrane protein